MKKRADPQPIDLRKTYIDVLLLCQRLPISRDFAYRKIKDGTIPYSIIGGKIMIAEDSVPLIEKNLEVTSELSK